MNFEQAKATPMSKILEIVGAKLSHEDETDAFYFSPLRDEKTASFHVNKTDNVWFDHGEGIGGTPIEFACERLKRTGADYTRVDGLRWINSMAGDTTPVQVGRQKTAKKPGWKVIREDVLEDLALFRYLDKRGINSEIAKNYVSEVYVRNVKTNKKYYAIGFKNEDSGYELRNSFLKSSISPKTITFIRGSVLNSKYLHIFEGFMDYLTFLSTLKLKGHHLNDVIVLNSVNCVSHAFPFIKTGNYKLVNTWLHNDEAGKKATEELNSYLDLEGISHLKKNDIYSDYKDLNEWHVKKPKPKLTP